MEPASSFITNFVFPTSVFLFYFVGIDNPSPNIKQQLKQTNISHFHSHFYNVGYRKIKSHIRNYESYYLSFKTIDEIQVW